MLRINSTLPSKVRSPYSDMQAIYRAVWPYTSQGWCFLVLRHRRAQLESAAAGGVGATEAPAGPSAPPGPAAAAGVAVAAAAAAGGMGVSSWAALESASSLVGRLPVSTAAVEVGWGLGAEITAWLQQCLLLRW
jgi:hypothetical protein